MEEERFEPFATLIAGVHGDILKLKARYAARLGLKPVHTLWLYLLWRHPEGMSASELAAAGRIDRGLVSREIDGLLKQGIVYTRETGERRRYGWKLRLTARGEALAEVISAVGLRAQEEMSRGVAREDLETFYRVLGVLAEGLDRLTENNVLQEVVDHERKTDR